jgi:ribonuclease Z
MFLLDSMAKIIFLGTADSIPSANRNHTAILLTKDGENILFDCGEGTQRQFRKAKLNPCKITKILISHWHGDHILGLPGLLSTLALSGYNRNLEIYGPEGSKKKFDEMLRIFSFKCDYEIVFSEVSRGRFFEDDEFYLEAEEMQHRIPCLAYSFVEKGHVRIKLEKVEELGSGSHLKDLKEGRDIVVGGKKVRSKDCVYREEDRKVSVVMDTRMNSKIVPFVKKADILISEGTYSSDFIEEAKKHMHLTVGQVAEVAKKAKVGKLMITHVSSRHIKNWKGLCDDARSVFENSYFPRDFDSFDL